MLERHFFAVEQISLNGLAIRLSLKSGIVSKLTEYWKGCWYEVVNPTLVGIRETRSYMSPVFVP